MQTAYKAFEDETNMDTTYRRNAIRSFILPKLEELHWNIDHIFTTYHPLVEELQTKPIPIPDYLFLPEKTLQSLAWSNWKSFIDIHLEILQIQPVSYEILKQLFLLVQKRKSFELETKALHFSFLDSLYIFPKSSSCFQNWNLQGNILSWNGKSCSVGTQTEIRTWNPGDRIQKSDGSSQKLSDLFLELRIPKIIRRFLPLGVREGKIVRIYLSLFQADWKDWIYRER